jgi:hypothetical protein
MQQVEHHQWDEAEADCSIECGREHGGQCVDARGFAGTVRPEENDRQALRPPYSDEAIDQAARSSAQEMQGRAQQRMPVKLALQARQTMPIQN